MAGRVSARSGSGKQGTQFASPNDERTIMADLRDYGMGTLGLIANVYDTPAAIGRGVATGKPLSGFGSFRNRVTGQDMLRRFGLMTEYGQKRHPYLAAFAGAGAEILTDPLTMFGFGKGALSTAGKAARAAGIIGDASIAATKKLGGLEVLGKGSRSTMTGRGAYNMLERMLPGGKGLRLENATARTRPFMGPRAAQNVTTLEETIRASNAPDAFDRVQRYLNRIGVPYDEVKNQKLGGLVSFDYGGVFKRPMVAQATGPFATKALDAADALGQFARWNPVTRGLGALVDRKVFGRLSEYDQISGIRGFDERQLAQAQGRRVAGQLAAKVSGIPISDEARRLLGAESLDSPQGTNFLSRLFSNLPTQGDMRLRAAIGAGKVDDLRDTWVSIRDDMFNQANKLGMRPKKLQDAFGGEWSPRLAREANFDDAPGKAVGEGDFFTRDLTREHRKREMMTPAGDADIRDVNKIPEVQRLIREGEGGSVSVQQAGQAIKRMIDAKHGAGGQADRNYLASLGVPYDPRVHQHGADASKPVFPRLVPLKNPDGTQVLEPAMTPAGKPIMQRVVGPDGRPVIDPATGKPQLVPKMKKVYSQTEAITQEQGEYIARVYMRKDKGVDAATPLFSEHPVNAQARAIVNQATARASARHIQESIGEAAMFVGDNPNAIPGTGNKPLQRAIFEIAQGTGLQAVQNGKVAGDQVLENVRQMIARKNNLPLDQVNLAQWTLPEKVITRLTAASSQFKQPAAVEQFADWIGKYLNLQKAYLLSYPSRHSRDIYSNALQLWMLIRNPSDVMYGAKVAYHALAGETDKAVDLLRELPGYNRANAAEIQAKFVDDVAGTGILQSLSSSDLMTSNQSSNLGQLNPFASKIRPSDFVQEFKPQQGRTWANALSDQFMHNQIRIPVLQKATPTATKSAMLNASQKINDYSDSLARLGGMVGLMRQGVDAHEAARRVTDALVDYSSLTVFERRYLKAIWTWYSYLGRSGKFAVRELYENPGGPYAQIIKAFNRLQDSDEETYIPEALRQQFAVRVPDSVLNAVGIPTDGKTTTFLKDFDVAAHDTLSLASINPQASVQRNLQRTSYNLLSQANPAIQKAVSLATGQDLFSRRPLEQSNNSIDRVYKALSGAKTNMPPYLRLGIEMIPGPRVSGIAGALADTSVPMSQRIPKAAVNALLGVKVQQVGEQYKYGDARRMIAEQMPQYMKDYTENYVPKELMPYLDQKNLQRTRAYNTFGRRLREARQ